MRIHIYRFNMRKKKQFRRRSKERYSLERKRRKVRFHWKKGEKLSFLMDCIKEAWTRIRFSIIRQMSNLLVCKNRSLIIRSKNTNLSTN